MKTFAQNFLRRNLQLLITAILLLIAGYLTSFLLKSNFSDSYWKNSIQDFLQQREKDFSDITKNQKLINDFSGSDYSADEFSSIVDKKFTFLLYQTQNNKDVLKFWNNQQLLPADSLLKKPDGNYFYSFQNGQYEFVKRSLSGDNNRLTAIALIPVRKQYYIDISSLKPEFENFPSVESRFHITQRATKFAVKSSFGNTLFYLEKKEFVHSYDGSWISIVLVLVSIVLFLIVLHNLAHSISETFGKIQGISFLVIVVLLLRSLVYFSPNLFHLRQFELFDPTVYSSSFILNSLGDLLINSLLLAWVMLFIKQEIGSYRFPVINNFFKKWAIIFGILLLVLVVTFIFTNIVLSLVADAKISFSVTNFFSLNTYSFIGFIILATLALSYFFITQILLGLISSLVNVNNIIIYIILAFLGLVLLTFSIKNPSLFCRCHHFNLVDDLCVAYATRTFFKPQSSVECF